MTSREFVVLGTAGQSPTRTRAQSSYALRWDRELIVFDPGEGTQRQFLLSGLSAARVTRVCITHFHGDHCLGLAGLLQRHALTVADRPISLHYPVWGRDHIDGLLEASAIDFDLRVRHEPLDDGDTLDLGSVSLRARALDHTVPTLGYRVESPPARHLIPERLDRVGLEGADVGQLLEDGAITVTVEGVERTVTVEEMSEMRPGMAVAFVMDTRPCDGARDLAAGVDLLVCEATYLHDHAEMAGEHGHLTARQAAELARDAGARQLVLSHFSERYRDITPLQDEAAAVFPDVVAAHDLERIPVPGRRR